jgi:hypothetical protein
MNTVSFEGISYNVDDILEEGLSEEMFVRRGIFEGKYSEFSPHDRVKLLKEAYQLVQTFNKNGAV